MHVESQPCHQAQVSKGAARRDWSRLHPDSQGRSFQTRLAPRQSARPLHPRAPGLLFGGDWRGITRDGWFLSRRLIIHTPTHAPPKRVAAPVGSPRGQAPPEPTWSPTRLAPRQLGGQEWTPRIRRSRSKTCPNLSRTSCAHNSSAMRSIATCRHGRPCGWGAFTCWSIRHLLREELRPQDQLQAYRGGTGSDVAVSQFDRSGALDRMQLG